MKYWLLIIFSILCLNTQAGILLAWDRSDDHTEHTLYKVYCSRSPSIATNITVAEYKICAGTNTQYNVELYWSGTWYFVCTALNAETNAESVPSNMISYVSTYGTVGQRGY